MRPRVLHLGCLLLACGGSSTSSPPPPDASVVEGAELVVRNARVYTAADAMPWAEALAVTEEAVTLYRRSGHEFLASSLSNLAVKLQAVGRTDEALAAIEEALRLGGEAEDRLRMAAVHARVLFALGRQPDAVGVLRAALASMPDDESLRDLGALLRSDLEAFGG